MKKTILVLIMIVLSIVMANNALGAPAAHWGFDETTGLIAHDSVGNHDGLLDNGNGDLTWTTDSWLGDGAIAMDNPGVNGNGDKIVINDTGAPFNDPNDFTVSTWFKPGVVSDRIIFAKTGNWTDIYTKGYELRMDGWGRKLMWYAGGSGGVFSSGVFLYGLEQNKWYNVITMRKGNEAKLYVNGMLIGTRTALSPITYAGTNSLMIGGVGNGPGWSFDGIIDDVTFYSYALSQGEMDTIYSPHVFMPSEPFSAEFLYSPELDTLHVQGYANLPAQSAEVRFKNNTGGYSGTSTCVLIDQNANPNYVATFTDVSTTWTRDTYNLEVAFFSDDSCVSATTDTAYGGEFDALRVIWIEEQLAQLNQTIQDLNITLQENLTAIWDEINVMNADIDWIEGEISDLWDAIAGLEDQVDVAWNYHAGVDNLFIEGYAPTDAVSAKLIWTDSSGSHLEWPPRCVNVDQTKNPEFGPYIKYKPQAEGWDADTWFLQVYFYDASGCAGSEVKPRAYGHEFDYLAIMEIYDNLNALTAALNATNASLQAQIDELYNITDEQAQDLTAIWDEIDGLWDAIIGLEDEVDVSWAYNAKNDNLFIEGYAPTDAVAAKLIWTDSSGSWLESPRCINGIDQTASPEFGPFIKYKPQTEGWAADTWFLLVRFYDTSGCTGNEVWPRAYGHEFDYLAIMDLYNELNELNATLYGMNATLQAQIDDLYVQIGIMGADIDAIQLEIAILWDVINAINHGTINLNHFDENSPWLPNHLRVWGEAPEGADEATVLIRFLDKSVYTSMTVPVETNKDNENTYDARFDLSEWPIEKYDVLVKFYDDDWMAGYDVGALFDDLLLLWLEENAYGFEYMHTTTHYTYNPKQSFVRKISWAFTPEESGEYWFELHQFNSDNNESITKEFAGGTCWGINAKDTKNFVARNVRYPAEEGMYTVQLRAHRCDSPGTVRSNRFRLNIVDLAKPLPENEAHFSELGIQQSPESGTWWTNEALLDMEALMRSSNGWSGAFGCLVYTPQNPAISPGGEAITNWLRVGPDVDNIWSCSGTLNVETLSSFAGDEEFPVTICSEPKEHGDNDTLCDNVILGYDTEAPTIIEDSLNPGVLDAIRGVWQFSADVTDNGEIELVEFFLINKTNASKICYLGSANNTVNDTWNLEYNTTGNCTPDGAYDFSVYAIDYAGNEAMLTIDPIIDNTPPEVVSVMMTGEVGAGFLIEALITDNLAGVESAYAELQAFSCEIPDESCNLEWCAEQYEEQEVCENSTELNESCFDDCMEGGDTQTCTEECTIVVENCEIQMVEIEPDCSSEHTAECYELEGYTVEDCIADAEVDCESWDEGESEWDSYADCVESQTWDCYYGYCDYDGGQVDQHTVSCEANCYADECEYVGENAEGEPIMVELSLVEGNALRGTWTGTVEGLDAGVEYFVIVHATDAAGNENEEGNTAATAVEVYSDIGYLVGVTTSVPDVEQNAQFSIGGAVVGSDGSTPTAPDFVTVDPWGYEPTLFGTGLYSTSAKLSNTGEQLITVTYTPDSACPARSYSGTTTINVYPGTEVFGGGGGGGGGSGWGDTSSPNTEERAEKVTKTEKTPVSSGDSGSGGGQQADESSGGHEEVSGGDEPAGDSLLTGQVTGGGILASMAWLWILLAIVGILLGLWYLAKR
ncbi:LamG domain-containing protein [Candidatus Woesearchaeota archaeon]|nr:LamG domain-containing protein [Candidatus Woesearchaeota archaeon]